MTSLSSSTIQLRIRLRTWLLPCAAGPLTSLWHTGTTIQCRLLFRGLRCRRAELRRMASIGDIADDLKIGGVAGQQWNAVNVGSSGDNEVDRAPTRLAATIPHSGRQTAPFARNLNRDRQCIERGFNRAQPVGANGALIVVAGDKYAEVQLGDRGDADRSLDIRRWLFADEYGRVEKRAHRYWNGSPSDAEKFARSASRVFGAGVRHTARNA